MIDRSATEPADVRAAPTWFVLGLVAMAALLAYIGLWRWATSPESFFGDDLYAYTAAADRLAATGSPYHADLFRGPIVSAENVLIGYLYPPVLAQLFLPIRAVPHFALAVAWSAVQAICLAILLPLASAGRSDLTLKRGLLALGFGLGFYPLQFAIFGGNLSGWLAIGVALSLASGPLIRGSVGAVATSLKLLPLPMFLAAMTDRRSRLAAVIPLTTIILVSLLVAPRAWSDFAAVLPNILRIGMADNPTNLSPANALVSFGLLGLGLMLGWVLAIGFALAAIASGIRDGYSNRVLAMAIFSVTFASSTLWDHYLAVLVPLIIWAWPAASTGRRSAIATFVVVAGGLWLRLNTFPEYRLVLLLSLVACCVAIVTTENPSPLVRPRPRSEPAERHAIDAIAQ